MRRRPRGLRRDEADLWARFVEDASPLGPRRREPGPEAPLSSTVSRARPAETRIPPLLDPPAPKPGGSIGFDLRPSVSARLAAQRVDMDRKKFGRMRRGKVTPEGRIDLHGLTQAEAHRALTGFLLMSHQVGRRLVLVITGKGGGPSLSGILRNQVPHWLSLPPLNAVVLQLAEAHRSHGGSGALYVYLRRNREG